MVRLASESGVLARRVAIGPLALAIFHASLSFDASSFSITTSRSALSNDSGKGAENGSHHASSFGSS